MSELFPPTMKDLKSAAKTATDDLLNGRVFFRFTTATRFPAVRMTEAGGGPDGGEAPIENVRVLFDVWGKPQRSNSGDAGSYDDVVAIVARLKSWLHTLHGPIGADQTTYVLNADVTSVVPGDDPDGGAPRQMVTALLTVRCS